MWYLKRSGRVSPPSTLDKERSSRQSPSLLEAPTNLTNSMLTDLRKVVGALKGRADRR